MKSNSVLIEDVIEGVVRACQKYVANGGKIDTSFSEGDPFTLYFGGPPWEVNHQFHHFCPQFYVGVIRGYDWACPIENTPLEPQFRTEEFLEGYETGCALRHRLNEEGFYVLAEEQVTGGTQSAVEWTRNWVHQEGSGSQAEGSTGLRDCGDLGGDSSGADPLAELRGSQGVDEAGGDCEAP